MENFKEVNINLICIPYFEYPKSFFLEYVCGKANDNCYITVDDLEEEDQDEEVLEQGAAGGDEDVEDIEVDTDEENESDQEQTQQPKTKRRRSNRDWADISTKQKQRIVEPIFESLKEIAEEKNVSVEKLLDFMLAR